MLKYNVIGNNVILVPIQNNYEIIAIAKWDKVSHSYFVNFMIKMKTVDIWDAINNTKTENIRFESTTKTINRDMAEYVTALSKTDFFRYYMERYGRIIQCFDLNIEVATHDKQV